MKNSLTTSHSNDKPEKMWPYGIIIAYIIFVGITLTFVFFTFTVKFDLVVPEYYSETLVYQDQIDRESNSLSLNDPISWEIKENMLLINFPKEIHTNDLSGSITMYRASNASLDQSFDVALNDDGIQSIPLHSFAK